MSLEGQILVIDDEQNIREGLKKILTLEKHTVDVASDGKEGLELAFKKDYDLIICDLKMPRMTGEEFLEQILEVKPYLKIIILTGHGTIQNAVLNMRNGAFDFFIKPFNTDKILITIQHALRERKLQEENHLLKEQISQHEVSSISQLIGNSKSIKNLIQTIKQVAKSKATILIEGESGTGKELVAKSIHELSDRRDAPLVTINCAALNPNLLESELFGHEKGAFTGALKMKKGRFELADGGTLFLDEIGEIPPSVQVKLLRVLQEQKFERVGGETSLSVDVRIITATNKDLFKETQKGEFREDLYYRINVVNIKVPSLKERATDIPLLINSFIKEFATLNKKEVEGISSEALSSLQEYKWPGNIRELKNVIEGMVVLSQEKILNMNLLPEFIKKNKSSSDFTAPFGLTLKEIEKKYILENLTLNKDNKSKTADILGIGRKTLHLKLEEYQE